MKLLIGGSPCTHWSIAQTKNRETEPSGLGWELFKNYLIAREKYKPDYFLYENNKSMATAIRKQITEELGVPPVLINSALVSAQNRQRLYWAGKRMPDGTYAPLDIQQPEDRGILLRDILETVTNEKGYALKPQTAEVLNVNPSGHGMNGAAIHTEGKCRTLTTNKGEGPKIIEPIQIDPQETEVKCINPTPDGKSRTVDAHMGKLEYNLVPRINNPNPAKQQYDCIAEPVRVCNINGGGQGNRIYSDEGKSCAIKAQSGGHGGHGQGLYATPIHIGAEEVKCVAQRGRYIGEGGSIEQHFEAREDEKTSTLTTVQKDNMAAIRIGTIENEAHNQDHDSQQYRVYAPDGKAVTLCGNGGGVGAKTGLYAVPVGASTKIKYPIYRVENGRITIKEKEYPIKLKDGWYIIRKLTVTECKRLQTVPDEYIFPVSDSQAYKMLGNGWTVDVIAHIMSHFQGLTEEPVEVLSMYDGMSCGHIALDKLGAEILTYFATEIDKYAIQTTQHNYPETVQLGDAFQVRDDGWSLPSETTDLSDAPEEVKQKILENHCELTARDVERHCAENSTGRLTYMHDGKWCINGVNGKLTGDNQANYWGEAVDKLAAYENTGLSPEVCANYKTFEDEAISKGVTFKRIVELMEVERQ